MQAPECGVAANLAQRVELALAVPCEPNLAGPPHARTAHLQVGAIRRNFQILKTHTSLACCVIIICRAPGGRLPQ